jgi:hypothetical protein
MSNDHFIQDLQNSKAMTTLLMRQVVAEDKVTVESLQTISRLMRAWTHVNYQKHRTCLSRITEYFQQNASQHTVSEILCTVVAATSHNLSTSPETSLIVERLLTTASAPHEAVRFIESAMLHYDGEVLPTYQGWLDIIDMDREQNVLSDRSPYFLYSMVENTQRPVREQAALQVFRGTIESLGDPLHNVDTGATEVYDDFGNYCDFEDDF